MSIRERLQAAGIIWDKKEVPEDDHGEEVRLFEKHEFKVFMRFADIYSEPDKVYGSLHYIGMYGIDTPFMHFPPGRTPMEVAYYIYTFCMGHSRALDRRIFEELDAIYDTWGHIFVPEDVEEVPDTLTLSAEMPFNGPETAPEAIETKKTAPTT